jgi:hypothetical protein
MEDGPPPIQVIQVINDEPLLLMVPRSPASTA